MFVNWLLIAVIIVILFCIWWGWHRGFLRILYSICALILSAVIAVTLTPSLFSWVKDNTSWYDDTVSRIETAIVEKTAVPSSEEDSGSSPNIAMGLLGSFMESSGANAAIAEKVGYIIVYDACFLFLLFISRILIAIVYRILRAIMHLPVLRTVNRLAGAISGGFEGVLICWIGMMVLIFLVQVMVRQYTQFKMVL